jgi:RNA polymerase sigma factor (sigma-70 family)
MPYVHRILVRRYLDEKRLVWARVRLTPTSSDDTAVGFPAEQSRTTEVEDRDELRAALAELPRVQRGVLVLRFACDMSIAEVAAVLGCSESNVKGYTSRGLAALRRLLGADDEGRQLRRDPTCIERRGG